MSITQKTIAPTARSLAMEKRWDIGFIVANHALGLAMLYASGMFSGLIYWLLLGATLIFVGTAMTHHLFLGLSNPYALISAYNCEEVEDWARASALVSNYVRQVKAQGREITFGEYKTLKNSFYEEQNRNRKAVFYGY